MHSSAHRAVGQWLGVVHPVFHRRQGTHVSKYSLQIVVGHVSEDVPRHNLREPPCTNVAGADSAHELSLIVVRDAGRIGGEVGTGHSSPRTLQCEAAGKV